MDDLAIRTEGLTKYYRGTFWKLSSEPALANLDLQVPRGVVFGFLGPNGAGKTTTIRCLMDLIRPSEGNAWVLGANSGDVQIRERIGYLPDNPSFSQHLSAVQFLNLCGKLLRIPSDQRRIRISEVLDAVDMAEHGGKPLRSFSRGMIQRIGIAQALLNRPDLLILDEPLVGLDPHGRKDLLEIVSQQKEKGTCIFFCSHILSDVEKLCDRVGILNKGRLLCSGPLQEMLGAKGIEIVVPPDQIELAKELMPEAAETHHDEHGAWRLIFEPGETTERLKERSLPAGVELKPRKETLEELFFRLTRGGKRHE